MTEGARVAETESTSSPGLGRDFHFYATGTAVSVVGDRIALIALVFLVISLSHSWAPALALFYVCRMVPTLLGGLLAGVFVDHFNRQRLMVGCDLARAALLVALPGLSALMLWMLYPLVVALYALTLVFEAAALASVPDVVPEEGMTAANAILQGIRTAADLAYAVGGALIAILKLQIPFYIDAATFVFSAAMISNMHIPHREAGPLPRVGEVGDRVREGLVYLVRNPFLKWSTLAFTFGPAAGGAALVLVPLYADHTLAHSPGLSGPLASGAFRFGFLEVSLGVGALLGSPVTVRLGKVWPRGRLVGIGILGMGLVDLLFAAIGNIYVAAPVMAVHGFFNSLFAISAITLVQTLTPSEVRGRVIAARGTIINTAIAVGSAAAGALLVGIPYRGMWLMIGATIALSSLFVWLRPDVRSQR